MTEQSPQFNVFKQANGQYRWIAFSSTAYKDQDEEIVSTKALSDDCDRADIDGNYGPLRWWHMPDMDLGDCDFNAMSGRVLVESGTFRDPDVAQVISLKAPELQLSIGFTHPPNEPDAQGVYHHIRRFERSLTPFGMASNLFTQFIVKEPTNMASLKERFQKFVDILGGDQALAERVQQSAEATQKDADTKAAFKSVDTFTINGVTYQRVEALPIEEDVTPDPPTTTEESTDIPASPDTLPPLTPQELSDITAAVAPVVAQEVSAALEPVLKAITERMTLKDAEGAQQKQALTALEVRLKETQDKLAELMGDQPKSTKGYRASQDPATIIADEKKLKETQPVADPITAFFSDVLPGMQPGT